MIFQDPYQSLNPRQTVGALVMRAARHPRHRRAATSGSRAPCATLESAGLAPAARYWDRYPHELSGGQRQRVVIAAAMALEPEALICDEPVSALDVSVRAQVLHVLMGLKRDRGLGLIFITHDLGLAWALCDRVAVMYLGRIVESGPTEQVIGDPRHPYTQCAAVGRADAVPARGAPHDPRRRAARRRATCRPAAASTRAARRRSTAARSDDPRELTPSGPTATARPAGSSRAMPEPRPDMRGKPRGRLRRAHVARAARAGRRGTTSSR